MSAEQLVFTAPEKDPRDSWLSVTRILKLAGLSPWQDVALEMLRRGTEHGLTDRQLRYILQGVNPDVLDRKAELGQMVHQACQDIENGMTEAWWSDFDFAPYVASYQRFKQETGYKATATEQKVYNDTYRYRGTLDSVGTMGAVDAILDIKTVVQMAADLPYQLAGYDLCLPPNPRRYRFGVQLKPDGTYAMHAYKDRNDSQIFLAAVAVAHAKGMQ